MAVRPNVNSDVGFLNALLLVGWKVDTYEPQFFVVVFKDDFIVSFVCGGALHKVGVGIV
jgi:hypothetical protein